MPIDLDDARAVLGKMTLSPREIADEKRDCLLTHKCQFTTDDAAAKQMQILFAAEWTLKYGSALVEEVAQLRAALGEISDKLPCDAPCVPEDSRCGTCGSRKFRWCAGCIARAALSPAPVQKEDK